jgi:pilus assembly protein Flp/PilA
METAMCAHVVRSFGQDKRAVTALEYGLIAGVIIVVCASAFAAVGNDLSNMITNMMTCYTNASSC